MAGVQWNGAPRYEPFGADDSGPWRGFQAWRADFDAILLQHARRWGVQVLQPCRALSDLMDKDRVAGIVTSQGPVQAEFVVDAAGDRQWLARQLGLGIRFHSPLLIAHYGYAEGACPVRDKAPAIVADEEGWTWTTRVRPQLYGWTRLLWGGQKLSKDWLPAEFRRLRSHGRTRGADVTWRIVAAPAGPGYFLVGDAAVVLDPASSHGVLKAIMSGMMAGHAILQVMQHGLNQTQAARSYSRWIHDWFKHDEGRLRELYAVRGGTFREGR